MTSFLTALPSTPLQLLCPTRSLMLQILWPTGGIRSQQVQRTIEYEASECTELTRQPNLDLNSNDLLPDIIAIYTIYNCYA